MDEQKLSHNIRGIINPILFLSLCLSLIQAGDLLFAYICFDNNFAGEVQHGCLVKEKTWVHSGLQLKSISHSSVEACAEACARRNDCDTFHVDFHKECFLHKGGTMDESVSANQPPTAGVCPKGVHPIYAWLRLLSITF